MNLMFHVEFVSLSHENWAVLIHKAALQKQPFRSTVKATPLRSWQRPIR